MSKEVYVLSPDTGLLGIPKQVQVSDDKDTSKAQHGWDVEYLMNAAINIDDYVKLESKMVTGFFRVYSLEIEGDNVEGCEMLSCGSADLEILDRIGYGYCLHHNLDVDTASYYF